MRAVSNTARGKKATQQQRASILRQLEALEKCNTVQNPAESDLLCGKWALLYQAPTVSSGQSSSSSSSDDDMESNRGETTEGPFLAAFQPLTKGLIRTQANLQIIDLPAGRVQNKAQFTVANGRWKGALNILGTAVKAEAPAGTSVDKVNVQFDAFVLTLGSISWKVPLTWVEAKGWIQTTYLDQDFRVGRGDKGSIFVAAKLPDDEEQSP
ncbi:MAG: hypothetical protein WDW38_009798 [Sanguina aurantia]